MSIEQNHWAKLFLDRNKMLLTGFSEIAFRCAWHRIWSLQVYPLGKGARCICLSSSRVVLLPSVLWVCCRALMFTWATCRCLFSGSQILLQFWSCHNLFYGFIVLLVRRVVALNF